MAQITANFSDRDSANLSLMRLRRSGVDFDLLSLVSQPNPANSISQATCGIYLSNMTPMESITCPQRKEDVTADDKPTQMVLSVKASHLEKAWDVLRGTGAKNISSKS